MFKTYLSLTKPGIIAGNSITAIAGFFLASQWHVNFGLFVAMLVGLALIIASACVSNNYMDRGIDTKMARTKKRAIAIGKVSGRNALVFAAVLGLLGTLVLSIFTTLAATIFALFGWFAYVFIYGVWKRRSEYGTVVGSISGAVPPVVGYVAVTGRFDLGALILFFIVAAWQMPHFFAIAIYRASDYAAAGIPVLPVVKGVGVTKKQMLMYIIVFIAATVALTVFGYAGYIYLSVALLLGLIWLVLSLKGFSKVDDVVWARKMFFYSLIVITVISIAISLNPVLR